MDALSALVPLRRPANNPLTVRRPDPATKPDRAGRVATRAGAKSAGARRNPLHARDVICEGNGCGAGPSRLSRPSRRRRDPTRSDRASRGEHARRRDAAAARRFVRRTRLSRRDSGARSPTARASSAQRTHTAVRHRATSPAHWSVQRWSGYDRRRGSGRVRLVQRKLARLRYRPGPWMGSSVPVTEGAVLRFQRAEALAADGIVGPRTLGRLRVLTARAAGARAAARRPNASAGPDLHRRTAGTVPDTARTAGRQGSRGASRRPPHPRAARAPGCSSSSRSSR